MPAWRPNVVPFARSIPSSTRVDRVEDHDRPEDLLAAHLLVVATRRRARSAGSARLRAPPASSVAPEAVASAIHSRMRVRAPSSITGPTSVSSSAGSPDRRAPRPSGRTRRRRRRAPAARRRSAARRCTTGRRRRTRSPASFAAALSTSASAATITGVELPSSSFTRLRGARSWRPQPTSLEPVNVISLTRSSPTRTSPISDAGPTTTLSQPPGSPASSSSSARKQRRERRLARGLQHDGAAGGERGRDLVRDEVAGEVERRDRSDDADRLAQREAELSLARLRAVHRDHLAGELAGLDRGERVGRHRARSLDARRLDRLARPRRRSSGRAPRGAGR